MYTEVSTLELPESDRFAHWQETISHNFVPLDFAAPNTQLFTGRLIASSMGSLGVCRVMAGEHRAIRSPLLAAKSDAHFLKLSMPTKGSAIVSQDGREALLNPGDIALYDTSRPYQMWDRSGDMLVLMFPQNLLRLPAHACSQLTARKVSGKTGIGTLVAPLLENLANSVYSLDELQPERLADNVLDLITTVYADLLSRDGYRPEDPTAVLQARIHAFIKDNLSDPSLTPEQIAKGCFVSIGYLHKLFRSQGISVSSYIKKTRLEECKRALLDPSRQLESVATIGAQWGFVDAAHFSRVFKAEYGLAPRDFRAAK